MTKREDTITRLRRLYAEATPGEWAVYEYKVAIHTPRGGHSTERLIGTAADHPQLHAPAPVVTLATGLLERPYVAIGEKDASLITDAKNTLPALLDVAEAARQYVDDNDDSEAYALLRHALDRLEEVGNE